MNGKLRRAIYVAGWILSVLGTILLFIGYFLWSSIAIQEGVLLNIVPLGWVTLIIGGLTVIFNYFSAR